MKGGLRSTGSRGGEGTGDSTPASLKETLLANPMLSSGYLCTPAGDGTDVAPRKDTRFALLLVPRREEPLIRRSGLVETWVLTDSEHERLEAAAGGTDIDEVGNLSSAHMRALGFRSGVLSDARRAWEAP
eukprot:Sspe_Gene.62921::Locus_35648_Transcript_1_1_Confidence_1.000_Length_677::g.62921::m.62921